MKKSQTTHSFVFNLQTARKKLIRPLDVIKQLGPDVIDLSIRVQGEEVKNGLRETFAEVYITNKTTPLSILVELGSSGVDPHYCPTNKEVFLPPKETVLQELDVLSKSNVFIDHIIIAKSSKFKRALIEASNHLKEKPKVVHQKKSMPSFNG